MRHSIARHARVQILRMENNCCISPKQYVPQALHVRLQGLSLTISEMYTSKRFITEDESSWLPEYWLTDMNLSTSVRLNFLRLQVRVAVSNLFDAEYQVLPGYPMPGGHSV